MRSLAQLANRGRLPRDVLARFPEFDAINRALFRHAQTQLVTELFKAQTELHALNGTGTEKGKGKERETDDPERQRLGARIAMLKEEIATIVPEFDRDADLTEMLPEEQRKLVATVKENGTKLAALYGELMEAARNLSVVGIHVGDIRVDEYFIHGLDRVAPKLRKQAALMLARVALIEDEIAKINPKFQRHVDDKSQNGKKSRDEISRHMELDTLLRLGLTRDDLLDMDLSADQLDVIHKLGVLGFRNAGEVKLQNKMHRKIRNRIFNTNAGRSIARSAFGLTTAQLAREYLDLVFRAVTGNNRKFDHQADDPEVCQAMKNCWREIMKLTTLQEDAIKAVNRIIEKERRSILRSIAKLADNPDDALRKTIREKHDRVVYDFLTLNSFLTHQQRRFATAMIRAAVLSARPATFVGDKPHHEFIDVYDASRHREKIIEILESWGMDVELFASLIEYFVFTRADKSELSPGTVTVGRLARWKNAFRPEEIFGVDASSGEEPEVRRRSWKERAKALGRDGLEFAASHFSGKTFHDMDPAFVDQIIATLPSMPDYEKISLRTNTLVQGGFSFSSGFGGKLPLAAGAGDQTGIIIKRLGRYIDVRLVSGALGNGQVGIGMEGAVGPAAMGGTGSLAGAKWDTEGSSLRFTVVDENGRENFEHVQSYLRSLLNGKLPSTNEWAAAASEWYATKKTGGTAKDILSVGAVVGAAVDIPVLGTVSAGVGLDAARERARRVRSGDHINAMSRHTISKATEMTTWSAAANAGVSVGFEHSAGGGISEVGAAAVKGKTIAGVSAGLFEIKYANVSFYDSPEGGWDWDFVVDIAGVESAEEALARCGPGFYERLGPLLDQTTTLDNGEEMPFGKALDQMLKLLRFNDGFLLQFVPLPSVRREVARRMRRIAQIEQQILPMIEPAAADERDPGKKQDLDRQRQQFKEEIAGHMHFIVQAKDHNNLENYQLVGAMIIPMLFQQNDMTVLDVLGMLKVTHVGVRLQDVICAWVPAPKEKSDREVAEAFLLGEARLSTISS